MENDIDINELERLAKAATPGPWKLVGTVEQDGGTYRDIIPTSVSCGGWCQGGTPDRADECDLQYISAANPFSVLSLIDSLRKAKMRVQILERNLRDAEESGRRLAKQAHRAEQERDALAEPQPDANSAPIEAIRRILTEVMDEAARNGAGSRSMPDDYVEVAAWLCGVSTKKASQPEADGWIPWAGGKWQTIETAPKDKFLLLCGPSGYTTTPLVFTTGIMHSNYHAGRWIDHANDDLMDWGFEPTHWMPLPAPPES